nr:hypothetical protein [Tanacetum cinerariifolium]
MSDSKDSTVTYTAVSSPFRGLSDIGSLGVDGAPMMPEDPYAHVVAAFQAPPSLDYVPGLKHPPSPDIVLEPVYPEFMPLEDEVLLAEEQLLPVDVSPTADSPGYIPKSDPEEDPKEDPADYPADGGDDDGDDDESSDDDEDDDDDDVEEEEDHPALADSIPPAHVHRVTARMSIREQPPTPVWSEAVIDRLLAIPSPPPLPLSSWSSPLPQIPSPPLPVSLPLPVSPPLPVSSPPLPASPTYPLGYRAAMIRLRAETPSTFHPLPLPSPIILTHTKASVAMMRAAAPFTYILAPRSETPPSGTPPLLPIPLPTSSSPLILPSTSHRADVPGVTLPPRKRLCITLGPRYDVGESSSVVAARPTGGFRADYGFVATLDNEIRRDPKKEDDKALISERVNILYRDRRDHARTARLIETEARLSSQAWVQSMDTSDLARFEKMAPKRTTRSTPSTTTTTTTTSLTDVQLKALINQGLANALATRDTDRSRNGEDNHDSRMHVRRQAPSARECTYHDFMKCKPLYFKGIEGVVELTQCVITWWNSHVMTVGPDVAYAMTWTNLIKKMTDKYCPRGEIKKLKGYNQRFQELALLCVRMFPEESDKVKRYVGGLPNVIHESVVASRPKTMQEAIEMATELMEKRNNTIPERQAKNKQKFDDTSKNNQNEQ